MTDLLIDSGRIETDAHAQPDISALFAWLDGPPLLNATDELVPLLNHLQTLRDSQATAQQRTAALGRLYARSMSVLKSLLPSFTGVALHVPIPRKTRQLARSLQELLRALADDLYATLDDDAAQQSNELRPELGLALWRCLNGLGKHLAISNLAASPAGSGIWQQLHQAFATARRLGLASHVPEGTASTLQNVYFSAVLLGCAQPASFTAREIDFVITYLEHAIDLIDLTNDAASPATFWIDPSRDAAAMACSRKAAPAETQVFYFSCDRLAVQLRKQLALLENGGSPQLIDLPEFSGTTAGRGVMRRLIVNWGEPGKRRFPRRRQNYRAVLCSGLHNLWHLFQEGEAAAVDTSSWMITNESPDGYAVMHVSGKIGDISVGDVTAIKIGADSAWQVCIVRWALSENQEHLELGLQILATRAVPALLALPAEINTLSRVSVLVLPKIQALHSSEMLVVPSGALENQPLKLVLVIEMDNIEVREMKSTHLDEQNSQIEVFSIEPDSLPS
ncbi:hypothetical protein [Propionivibrio sp.]|uniref:hypothetical protein n=1 Tax=Propionivibrio sp. TaxID=2212460 RepID=UPI0025FBF529|nr:hypothetical protein [Propionivibrio sp.]MBK7355798.1 hypothetical protein [Propionivibrio sp.]MBK8400539.1 hypothetical protein [Propionivibrio sp.]MBK8744389.1 hypothetical protein [Propionivibrio sp.]